MGATAARLVRERRPGGAVLVKVVADSGRTVEWLPVQPAELISRKGWAARRGGSCSPGQEPPLRRPR